MTPQLEFCDPRPASIGTGRATLGRFEHAGMLMGRVQLWCGSEAYISPVGLRVLAVLLTTLADDLEREVRP